MLLRRNVIPLHDIDKYIIIITGPIILVIQLVIVIAMVKYKMVSRPPEDAIFALIIAESVACMSLFAHASTYWVDLVYHFFYSTDDPMPSNFVPFCVTTGIINTFAMVVEQTYLLYFLIFIIVNVKQSIKHSTIVDI